MNERVGEYVVEWQHWRYPDTVDEYRTWYTEGQISAGLADAWVASEKLHPVGLFRHWRLTANRWAGISTSQTGPSGHGGKTECCVYQIMCTPDGEPYPERVVSAVSVCSWRDQFSRRVGRLYSLALALCELKAERTTCWSILLDCLPGTLCGKGRDLAEATAARNKPAVKAICAEIVAAWRKPKRTCTKPTPEQIEQWRDAARRDREAANA